MVNFYNFTRRATSVPVSMIGHMMRYASKYDDVLSLGQGTPIFTTPEFIFEYLIDRSKKKSKRRYVFGRKS